MKELPTEIFRRGGRLRRAALPLLCGLAALGVTGCTAKPDAAVAEGAITAHFEERGYLVKDISIGRIYRNPVAERVYMAPLTYVVHVPSLVLETGAAAGDGTNRGSAGVLTFAEVSFKLQALSPPRQGWAVSEVAGIDPPRPFE